MIMTSDPHKSENFAFNVIYFYFLFSVSSSTEFQPCQHFLDIRLTDTVEKGFLLALTGAAITIH